MATTKNITMKQFNGTDYDTLYPKTQGSQITGAVPIASGGTGGTTAKVGMYNLLNGMSAITPTTNDLFPFKDVSGSTSGLVTLTNLITAMGSNGVITTSNLNTQVANLGFTKIQTGSYVGTNTYGASSPCSLTFDFVPKLIVVKYNSYDTSGVTTPIELTRGGYIIAAYLLDGDYKKYTVMDAANDNDMLMKIVDKTIYYYSKTSSGYQMNGNTTYFYMALG